MLRFVKRGSDNDQPIGKLPGWLSSLLRTRGVDTPEKAERFLHPSLDDLYDPMLMQGMDKAVRIIRRAIEEHTPVMIYGDYDVDGVCATSILLETLRELGGTADFYIPDRHGEGYGLNCDAVREIAGKYKLLITVDCGVTNHEEVKLAQMLGMTVIVSDHHQLADTPSPADVVLNPLLGEYPFRRLCGAGVALKICQALQGMDGVLKRIELAAMATVADIVPLIDENRIIVKAGLTVLDKSQRHGVRALMNVSGIKPPVNAGQVGFRLAPRLNAGGRLEDASQGVRLLTAADMAVAEPIAQHLEENNRQRQELERAITQQAMETIAKDVDFRTDRVIIVMGEGWNNGVIGLAAGRICEKYHFPTIVLSRQEDGTAVGSCRSISGVNIHGMLSICKDLFIRFGGHEMAAGLTMRSELVPELRRRLNLAIDEHCDPKCYVPEKEYDLALHFAEVDMALVDALDALQPTGYGNPSPVFLTRDAQVQAMRPVGAEGAHLKLSLLKEQTLRDGIGFSMGSLAEQGLERVDVLFTPERNEFRGNVSVQLQVRALRPAEGSAPLPRADVFFRALLQEITVLAANNNPISSDADVLTKAAVRKLMSSGRGTLLIAHERELAAAFLTDGMADAAVGLVKDDRAFTTVLCAPDLDALTDIWTDIVLLDGNVIPGELDAISDLCPRAALHTMRTNPALACQLKDAAMDDDTLRSLYKRVRVGAKDLAVLCEDCGLTSIQVSAGLTAFSQVRLADYSPEPFVLTLLPPVKCCMEDSPVIRMLRSIARML